MSGNLQHTVSINVANHNRSCHSQLLTFETSCKHARARMRCSPFANGMLCRSPKPTKTKTTQNINNFGCKNLPCQEYSCEKVFYFCREGNHISTALPLKSGRFFNACAIFLALPTHCTTVYGCHRNNILYVRRAAPLPPLHPACILTVYIHTPGGMRGGMC